MVNRFFWDIANLSCAIDNPCLREHVTTQHQEFRNRASPYGEQHQRQERTAEQRPPFITGGLPSPHNSAHHGVSSSTGYDEGRFHNAGWLPHPRQRSPSGKSPHTVPSKPLLYLIPRVTHQMEKSSTINNLLRDLFASGSLRILFTIHLKAHVLVCNSTPGSIILTHCTFSPRQIIKWDPCPHLPGVTSPRVHRRQTRLSTCPRTCDRPTPGSPRPSHRLRRRRRFKGPRQPPANRGGPCALRRL